MLVMVLMKIEMGKDKTPPCGIPADVWSTNWSSCPQSGYGSSADQTGHQSTTDGVILRECNMARRTSKSAVLQALLKSNRHNTVSFPFPIPALISSVTLTIAVLVRDGYQIGMV